MAIADVKSGVIEKRINRGYVFRQVPDDAGFLTVGVDVSKTFLNYTVRAQLADNGAHVVEYGRIEVPPESAMPLPEALFSALTELQADIEAGYPTPSGAVMVPRSVWIDSGWMREVVVSWTKQAGARYVPCFGRGTAQQFGASYYKPKSTGARVLFVGQGYHFSKAKTDDVIHVELHTDHWKSVVHQRLACPIDSAMAMTLFSASADSHRGFAKHLTAEKQVTKFIKGKGEKIVWEIVSRNNHYLDSTCYSEAAAHYVGELIAMATQSDTDNQNNQTKPGPDNDRPYLISQR